MQKANISDDRLTTFLANAGEARHSFFRNPIMNQAEERLIRERLHCGPADNIWCMFTTEPVKSMASRAFRLEDILPLNVRRQRGSWLLAVRDLAKDVVGHAKENQHQPKL